MNEHLYTTTVTMSWNRAIYELEITLHRILQPKSAGACTREYTLAVNCTTDLRALADLGGSATSPLHLASLQRIVANRPGMAGTIPVFWALFRRFSG